MKRRFVSSLVLVLMLMSAFCAAAQGNLSDTDRQRWLQEIRTYKHEFLAKELSLSKDQQREFFALYDRMEDEVERLNSDTRDTEQRAIDNKDATDLELSNAARTIFELKRAEGQIEMTYFDKFRDILTPRQLLMLKNAERKFTQQLVNHHRRAKRTTSK